MRQDVRRLFYQGLWERHQWALNAASFDYLSKEKVGFVPRGMMMLAKADERQAFERRRKTLGWSISLLKRHVSAFRLFTRARYAGFSESAQILIQIYCFKDFQRRRAHGGEIMLSSGVESISRHGDSWYVRAGSRDFSAHLLSMLWRWADQVALMAGFLLWVYTIGAPWRVSQCPGI